MTVADLMNRDVTTLGPRHLVKTAIAEARLHHIRHLPILGRDGKLVGLVTQRDLIGAQDAMDRPVSHIMRRDLKTVRANTPAHEAAYVLMRYRIGCVLVTDESGALIGIITDTDFVHVAYRCLGGRVPPDQIEAEEREADRV